MESRDGGMDRADSAFAWVPGPECGSWIAERLDAAVGPATEDETPVDGPALGWMVPRGYDAIVRVLHPFFRQWPEGTTWAEYERLSSEAEADEDWERLPEIAEEPVTWAEAVDALRPREERQRAGAKSAHPAPGSLSRELVGLSDDEFDLDDVAEDGYRYELPRDGSLDTSTLARVARVLEQHTGTPDSGIAAVWEGFGGLVSGEGVAFITAFNDGSSSPPPPLERARRWWLQRAHDFRERRTRFGTLAALQSLGYRALRLPHWIARLRGRHHEAGDHEAGDHDDVVFGPAPGWESARALPLGSGVLSRRAATGPRLELPDRDYVCFEAGITAFTSNAWIAAAPWIARDEAADHPQTPTLVWPKDRDWYLVSDIDLDSTLIACSRSCADALLTAPGIEAHEIDRDTRL